MRKILIASLLVLILSVTALAWTHDHWVYRYKTQWDGSAKIYHEYDLHHQWDFWSNDEKITASGYFKATAPSTASKISYQVKVTIDVGGVVDVTWPEKFTYSISKYVKSMKGTHYNTTTASNSYTGLIAKCGAFEELAEFTQTSSASIVVGTHTYNPMHTMYTGLNEEYK